MQDERRFGHFMKDDILQVLRDAFPAKWGISDNDAESRKNAGAKKRKAGHPRRVPGLLRGRSGGRYSSSSAVESWLT